MNKRIISKILMESSFNPNEKNGPVALLMRTSDSNYLEQRAMECIINARGELGNESLIYYHEQIQLAISLLALARVKKGN